MSFLRSLSLAVAGLALAASFTPAFAVAQYYSPAQVNNCGNNWYSNTTNCNPGNLLVYVQVAGNQYSGYNRQPQDFTVTVSGINASPSSFLGSLSGTQVSVSGSYSVTALQIPGYSASYSAGCSGNLSQGDHATCVVTESNSYNNYYPYPTPYPYPYFNPTLGCTPSYQTVNLGQTVSFEAQGGAYSQFNWTTPTRSYLNVGPSLNIVFTQTGTQTVTVFNGELSASCTVNVVPSGAPAYVYPTSPAKGVYVTPTYVPSLPNTGFEPQNGAALAFALVAFIALAFISLPYVRKAFAIVLG